jgi:SAM-dependent methyltransferase
VGVADDGSGLAESVDFTATNRQTYDRIACRYVENQERQRSDNEHLFSALETAFLATVPDNGLVADLGCGPASDGARFAGRGLRVVGMDLSAGMLSVASGRLGGRVAQADLRALPIASDCLDGIWCAAALLHVPEEDTERVLSEFKRSLRPSAVLALVTALGESAGFEVAAYAPEERRWFVYRSADRLRQQLNQAGFGILEETQLSRNRLWLSVLARPD